MFRNAAFHQIRETMERLGNGALKPAWEPIVLARKPLVGTNPRPILEIDLEKPAREVDVRPASDNALVTHRTERQSCRPQWR